MGFSRGVVIACTTVLIALLMPGVSSAQAPPTLPPNHRTFASFTYAQGGAFGLGVNYQFGPAWDAWGGFSFASVAGVTATAWGLGLNYHFSATPSFDSYVLAGVAGGSVAGLSLGTAFGLGLGANIPLAANFMANGEIAMSFGGGASVMTYGIAGKYFFSDQAAVRVGFTGGGGVSAWVIGFDYHFSPQSR